MGAAAVQAERWEESAASPDRPQQPDDLRTAVLSALANAGNPMLSSMLESGDWQVQGNELAITVSSSQTVIDMSLGADARRLIVATASGVLGKPAKLKIVSGPVPQAASSDRSASNGGGRSRVEQDPIVRRMKDKFGAEIRTIIDYKEKKL